MLLFIQFKIKYLLFYFCFLYSHVFYSLLCCYFALNAYFLQCRILTYTVFLIFILVITVEIVVYILTYQNQLQVYNNLIPIRYKALLFYASIPISSSSFFCIIYIYSIFYVINQWYIVTIIIYLHNLMMLRRWGSKESK